MKYIHSNGMFVFSCFLMLKIPSLDCIVIATSLRYNLDAWSLSRQFFTLFLVLQRFEIARVVELGSKWCGTQLKTALWFQQINNCVNVFKLHFQTRLLMIQQVVFKCTHITMPGFSLLLCLLHWLILSTNQTNLVSISLFYFFFYILDSLSFQQDTIRSFKSLTHSPQSLQSW